MQPLSARMKAFGPDETGASAVEYAVLASLIIAVCVAVILSLGENTKGLFSIFNDSYSSKSP